MEYRKFENLGVSPSLLGFGCMRFPMQPGADSPTGPEVNEQGAFALVDYAIAHGVNYFDTSPAYCRGHSEHATGVALSRHPRDKYFIATKLSNFAPSTWSREASMEMCAVSLARISPTISASGSARKNARMAAAKVRPMRGCI